MSYSVENRGYKTPCWIWQKCKVKTGYGRAAVPGTRLVRYAHIVIYELFKGKVPSGLQLNHLCRNRACVNPEHLEPVPQAINLRRGCHVRLNPQLIAQATEMRESGAGWREICSSLGVVRSTISAAVKGTTWREVRYPK
jgi:hypothetical protein